MRLSPPAYFSLSADGADADRLGTDVADADGEIADNAFPGGFVTRACQVWTRAARERTSLMPWIDHSSLRYMVVADAVGADVVGIKKVSEDASSMEHSFLSGSTPTQLKQAARKRPYRSPGPLL